MNLVIKKVEIAAWTDAIYQLLWMFLWILVIFAIVSPAAWPIPAHSVAICEGLEDWAAATDFSNISDSDEEEDQPAPLVRLLS